MNATLERPTADLHGADAGRPLLTREQVLGTILAMNPSAAVPFLQAFRDDSLRDYLAHLQAAAAPRGPAARWVRSSSVRAAAVAERLD